MNDSKPQQPITLVVDGVTVIRPRTDLPRSMVKPDAEPSAFAGLDEFGTFDERKYRDRMRGVRVGVEVDREDFRDSVL